MIDDERGMAILEGVVVLRSAGLTDSDAISTQLFSAVYAQALKTGMTPREVILALWDAFPSDDDWEPVMRERHEQAIDLIEARGL